MALETLKVRKEIGGFEVYSYDTLNNERHYGAPSSFIRKDSGRNIISFQLQYGPIKENGVNGCQVDTLIHAAKAILIGLNKKHPCQENTEAIKSLGHALGRLYARTKDREPRGVEGTNQL